VSRLGERLLAATSVGPTPATREDASGVEGIPLALLAPALGTAPATSALRAE